MKLKSAMTVEVEVNPETLGLGRRRLFFKFDSSVDVVTSGARAREVSCRCAPDMTVGRKLTCELVESNRQSHELHWNVVSDGQERKPENTHARP